MVKEISREELKAKMDRRDDFVLVEALSQRHYESSHLPGAINLPYEFVDDAEKVLPDKRAEIVVYCMNEECESSRQEAWELEEMGYRHVLHYAGGKQGWIRAGLPVEGRWNRTRYRGRGWRRAGHARLLDGPSRRGRACAGARLSAG